jgi:uncharacterized membrane protein
MPSTIRFERTLQVVVVFLAALGVERVVYRTYSLLFLPADFWDTFYAPRGLTDLGDVRYAQHAGIVVAHALPALIFVLLGPLQFVRRIRNRRIAVHRWSGRVFVVAGAAFGITGLGLGFTTALGYGGPNETAATIALATVLLFSLAKAVVHIRNHRIAQHREWMIRAFAMGLTVGTVPLVAALFSLSAAVRQAPREYLGICFWVGFTVNLIAAEAWINHTRPAQSPISPHAETTATHP